MNRIHFRWLTATLILVVGVIGLAGCSEHHAKADKKAADAAAKDAEPGAKKQTPAPQAKQTEPEDPEVRAERDKLSPEERKLVDAQEWCVTSGHPLGSMDAPIKLTVKDQPVYICCGHCKKAAEKDPDATLAKVKEYQTKKAAQVAGK